jgi:hypothetical protein
VLFRYFLQEIQRSYEPAVTCPSYEAASFFTYEPVGPMITFANGEVILDVVIRREALAPRPYAEIKTIGDALKMPLAWPFNRVMFT